jgi:hypothetical protein
MEIIGQYDFTDQTNNGRFERIGIDITSILSDSLRY